MKRSLALLLALVMLLALCACGEPTPPPAVDESEPAPAQTEPAPEETEPAPEETAEPEEEAAPEEPEEIIVTDMIGREVALVPGSYTRVVCIGAGALRMYSYIGDVNLLCGVEDIDNASLAEWPAPTCWPTARPLRLCPPAAWAAPRPRPPRRNGSWPATRTS